MINTSLASSAVLRPSLFDVKKAEKVKERLSLRAFAILFSHLFNISQFTETDESFKVIAGSFQSVDIRLGLESFTFFIGFFCRIYHWHACYTASDIV